MKEIDRIQELIMSGRQENIDLALITAQALGLEHQVSEFEQAIDQWVLMMGNYQPCNPSQLLQTYKHVQQVLAWPLIKKVEWIKGCDRFYIDRLVCPFDCYTLPKSVARFMDIHISIGIDTLCKPSPMFADCDREAYKINSWLYTVDCIRTIRVQGSKLHRLLPPSIIHLQVEIDFLLYNFDNILKLEKLERLEIKQESGKLCHLVFKMLREKARDKRIVLSTICY